MKKSKQVGMALIQVLIISVILIMLGLYINQTVKFQVATANQIKNAYQSSITIESVQAELLHALLTNHRYRNIKHELPLIQKWNFHGKPFSYQEGVDIIIQDVGGLISLNHLNAQLALVLFEQLGHTGNSVNIFLDSLADWKDKDKLKRLNGAEERYYLSEKKTGPRNGYLQDISEVLSIREGNILTLKQWNEFFSLAVNLSFRPLNAPDKILQAFINNEQAYNQVIEHRKAGKLNSLSFYQATGIDAEEKISFNTSRQLKITIAVKQQKTQLRKDFVVDLRPNSLLRPVTLYNVTWNKA